MKKRIIGILVVALLAGLAFRLLWSGLWLERLRAFFRAPVQGKQWQCEVEKYRMLYKSDSIDLFFLGDSHMEQCEWQELLPEFRCANRGIGGETTSGLLLRLNSLPENGRKRTVFLQTGTNDLFSESSPEEISNRYEEILKWLISRDYNPVPSLVFPLRYQPELNKKGELLNSSIRSLAGKYHCRLININPMISENGQLSAGASSDGVHLNANGYAIWLKEISQILSARADPAAGYP
jgi:lysophospholipase L1-like esterase